jgi:hypothetical protein
MFNESCFPEICGGKTGKGASSSLRTSHFHSSYLITYYGSEGVCKAGPARSVMSSRRYICLGNYGGLYKLFTHQSSSMHAQTCVV